MKSVRCRSTYFAAYLRHSARICAVVICAFFEPSSAVDLDFDRQAVAIPAGDVGRVEALHGLELDDEILEDFVERVAEVDVAVGVGRAVVQDIHGTAGAGGANLRVQVLGLPASSIFGSI